MVCHYSVVPHRACFTMSPGLPTARDSLVAISSARRLASAAWQTGRAGPRSHRPFQESGMHRSPPLPERVSPSSSGLAESRGPLPLSWASRVCHVHHDRLPVSVCVLLRTTQYWTWERQSSDVRQPCPLPSFGSWQVGTCSAPAFHAPFHGCQPAS